MPHTRKISSAVGSTWKTMDVSKKLMPFVPLSIALVRPPVCRERWKFRSSRKRCSKTLQATRRIAFCATLANTAFRASWKRVALILVTPSRHPFSFHVTQLLSRRLHARIIEPATVHAVPPTARKSMFIESTMLLK